jgi:hypothetical protein
VTVVLLTTATLSAMASTVTVAPARKPVPRIVTAVGRAVEPVDGEIAVTLGAAGGSGVGGAGPDGDLASQAANADRERHQAWPLCLIVGAAMGAVLLRAFDHGHQLVMCPRSGA